MKNYSFILTAELPDDGPSEQFVAGQLDTILGERYWGSWNVRKVVPLDDAAVTALMSQVVREAGK